MERQQTNAAILANWLITHSTITQVFYAGLKSHLGYSIKAAQARGAGSMISFRTDTPETAHRIWEQVKLIIFAENLGGRESLITYPMTQTHPDVSQAIREYLGITETLLRLSVGLENPDDIIADLSHALGE